MTISALDMPFENQSIGGIFMIDTLHHIPDMDGFLKEADRTLDHGGKIIMIEPVNSMFGRFIYKNFHHEPFDVDGGWTIPSTGPLSGANGALPWIVFERDAKLFKEKFPNFEIETIQYRNPLLYLISGGVSFKQLLPNFLYQTVSAFDYVLPKIFKQFSMFQLIVVTRK
jgi:ubiquinone/menaquinone biosynthesis C-methylase UbiE